MDPERWSELQELLLRLEGLDVAARGELLDAECGDDPAFRRQVEGMLADLLRPETEDWIGSSIKSLLPEDLNKIPERLGRYRITGEIGRGGLAVVLAAERDDQEYSQKVAIKLIRRGLDTAELLLRLRQERQILARLRHPNIAALIDGGSTRGRTALCGDGIYRGAAHRCPLPRPSPAFLPWSCFWWSVNRFNTLTKIW